MAVELDSQLDQINTSKDHDLERVKENYAKMFHEKAEELNSLRHDYDQAVRTIEQKNRALCDLEYKEKELQDLMSKKHSCHHREFESKQKEVEVEIDTVRNQTEKAEADLEALRSKFQSMQADHKLAMANLVFARQSSCPITETKDDGGGIKSDESDSGVNISSSQDTTSGETLPNAPRLTGAKRKRARKKRR